MKQRYDVYVADANGWLDGCPNYEEVFFGEHAGIFRLDGDSGAVEIVGHREAVAFRKHLETSGDWVAPPEINAAGVESRPRYAIRKTRT
jgi:hypothetical protein